MCKKKKKNKKWNYFGAISMYSVTVFIFMCKCISGSLGV